MVYTFSVTCISRRYNSVNIPYTFYCGWSSCGPHLSSTLATLGSRFDQAHRASYLVRPSNVWSDLPLPTSDAGAVYSGVGTYDTPRCHHHAIYISKYEHACLAVRYGEYLVDIPGVLLGVFGWGERRMLVQLELRVGVMQLYNAFALIQQVVQCVFLRQQGHCRIAIVSSSRCRR
jgi:hypothetical protein